MKNLFENLMSCAQDWIAFNVIATIIGVIVLLYVLYVVFEGGIDLLSYWGTIIVLSGLAGGGIMYLYNETFWGGFFWAAVFGVIIFRIFGNETTPAKAEHNVNRKCKNTADRLL